MFKKQCCPRLDVDFYITSRTDIDAQKEIWTKSLNSNRNEIFIHCSGKIIRNGVNLALDVIEAFGSQVSYEINTATLRSFDSIDPLTDADEYQIKTRNISTVHIHIWKNSVPTLKGNRKKINDGNF